MKSVSIIIFFSFISAFFISAPQAAIDVYQFNDEEKTKRFKRLTEELRCPKCQNQNIADSNAEIAQDLRAKLQEMLVADKTNDEIVQYMVDRYGDFVLYEPKLDTQTFLLWFGPVILLLSAFLIVFFIVRLRTRKDNDEQLNSDQQQQLDDLLNKQD